MGKHRSFYGPITPLKFDLISVYTKDADGGSEHHKSDEVRS